MIYADTRGMLFDRVTSLRDANVYEKQSYRHILGLPYVTKNGGDEAETETPFMVVRVMHDGKTDVFATGVYLDVVRAAGNDLKFKKRLVVCDSSRIDTLLALPL
jgi:anthranilate 1,2-dioxygenase small subunit